MVDQTRHGDLNALTEHRSTVGKNSQVWYHLGNCVSTLSAQERHTRVEEWTVNGQLHILYVLDT